MLFEFRGRCPRCKTERAMYCQTVDPVTPDALDQMEADIDRIGSWDAHCPKCDMVEAISFFVDGKQQDSWLPADEYERRGGPEAGPLPPRPWRNEE